MGSTGAFLSSGGFTEYNWEEVGKMYGIKILKKKTNDRPSLPPYSNTPGTAYLLLEDDGSFKQFRQYGEGRKPEFDIDYGQHKSDKKSLHLHQYINGERQNNPHMIVNESGEIMDPKLYNRFKKLLKGLKI